VVHELRRVDDEPDDTVGEVLDDATDGQPNGV
jgi:hypothetical protein